MWAYKLTLITAVAAASHERSQGALRTGSPPSTNAKLEPALVKAVELHLALSIEGKEAMRELLHDLMVNADFGVTKGKKETIKEFMPKCLAHVNKLVHTIDRSYTDMQLKSVLQQECLLSKEFPASHPSKFQSHEACMKFADQLSAARMKELETGETAQYKTFCKDYYEHGAVQGVKVCKGQGCAGDALNHRKKVAHPLVPKVEKIEKKEEVVKVEKTEEKAKKVEKIEEKAKKVEKTEEKAKPAAKPAADKKPTKSAAAQMLAGFTVAVAVANTALAC